MFSAATKTSEIVILSGASVPYPDAQKSVQVSENCTDAKACSTVSYSDVVKKDVPVKTNWADDGSDNDEITEQDDFPPLTSSKASVSTPNGQSESGILIREVRVKSNVLIQDVEVKPSVPIQDAPVEPKDSSPANLTESSKLSIAKIEYEDGLRIINLERFDSFDDFAKKFAELPKTVAEDCNVLRFQVRVEREDVNFEKKLEKKQDDIIKLCKTIFPGYDCRMLLWEKSLKCRIEFSSTPCKYEIIDKELVTIGNNSNEILWSIAGQILETKYDGSANCEILMRLAIPIQNSSESQIKNLKDALNQLFKYELICGSNTKINIYECADEKIVVEIKNPLFLNLLRPNVQANSCPVLDSNSIAVPTVKTFSMAVKPSSLAIEPQINKKLTTSQPVANLQQREEHSQSADDSEMWYTYNSATDSGFETVTFTCKKKLGSVEEQINHLFGGKNKNEYSKKKTGWSYNMEKILGDRCNRLVLIVFCNDTEVNKKKINTIIENVFQVSPTFTKDKNSLHVSISTDSTARLGELFSPKGQFYEKWEENLCTQIQNRIKQNNKLKFDREAVSTVIFCIPKMNPDALLNANQPNFKHREVDFYTNVENLEYFFQKKIFASQGESCDRSQDESQGESCDGSQDEFYSLEGIIKFTEFGDLIMITFQNRDNIYMIK